MSLTISATGMSPRARDSSTAVSSSAVPIPRPRTLDRKKNRETPASSEAGRPVTSRHRNAVAGSVPTLVIATWPWIMPCCSAIQASSTSSPVSQPRREMGRGSGYPFSVETSPSSREQAATWLSLRRRIRTPSGTRGVAVPSLCARCRVNQRWTGSVSCATSTTVCLLNGLR